MLRRSRHKPLVVYVHIPKTAGSSINHALQGWGRGTSHVERYRSEPAEFLKIAARADWISGHISRAQFEQLLVPLDRPIRWFSSMREPGAHVASHYNWLIEIFHKGGKFYEGHNSKVKEISETIRASDNADPDQVIQNLNRFRGLFLNMQSRYLESRQGDAFAGGDFEYVCDDSDIDMLLDCMGPGRRGVPRENASAYHFDKAIFRTAKLQSFLVKANADDYAAYRRLLQSKQTARNVG